MSAFHFCCIGACGYLLIDLSMLHVFFFINCQFGIFYGFLCINLLVSSALVCAEMFFCCHAYHWQGLSCYIRNKFLRIVMFPSQKNIGTIDTHVSDYQQMIDSLQVSG